MPKLKTQKKGFYFVHNKKNESDVDKFIKNTLYGSANRVYEMADASAVIMLDTDMALSPQIIGSGKQPPSRYYFNIMDDLLYMKEFQRAQLMDKDVFGFGSAAYLLAAMAGSNVFLDHIDSVGTGEDIELMNFNETQKKESIPNFGKRKNIIDPYALEDTEYMVVGSYKASQTLGVMDRAYGKEQKWTGISDFIVPEIVWFDRIQSLAVAPPFYKKSNSEANGEICSLIYTTIYQ